MKALDIDEIPEYEVLERIIHNVVIRQDSGQAARELLAEFGTLANIIDAPQHELQKIKGIGPAASSFLNTIPFFYKKYRMSKWNNHKSFKSHDDIIAFMHDTLVGYTHEVVSVLCLDSAFRYLAHKIIFEGDEISVTPNIRKLADFAMSVNATNIVLAHNHPNNDLTETHDDVNMTKHIYNALAPLKIKLVDHIIYTDTDHNSLGKAFLIPCYVPGSENGIEFSK